MARGERHKGLNDLSSEGLLNTLDWLQGIPGSFNLNFVTIEKLFDSPR